MTSQPDPSKRRARLSRGVIALLICIALIPLVGVIGLFWHRHYSASLAQEQIDALAADGLPTTPEELNDYYTAVPDDKNAALLYAVAFSNLVEADDSTPFVVPGTESTAAEDEPQSGWDKFQPDGANGPARREPEGPTLANLLPYFNWADEHDVACGAAPTSLQRAAMTHHLDQNAEALLLLHEASALPDSRFPLTFSSNAMFYNIPLPHLSELRESARILALETMQHALAGDDEKAVASVIAARRTGRAIENEPILVSSFVSIACDAIATKALMDLISRIELTEAQCQKLIDVWNEGQDGSRIEHGLAGEIVGVNQVAGAGNLGATQGIAGIGVLDMSGLLDKDRAFMTRMLHAAIRANRLPLTKRRRAAEALSAQVDAVFSEETWKRVLKGRILSGMLLPAIDGASVAEIKGATQTRLAIAALRLEQLHRREGTYPDSLDAVAKAFPDTDLTDPLSGKRIGHKQTDEGRILWSVGEDGKDNGGDDSERRDTRPDMVFRINR